LPRRVRCRGDRASGGSALTSNDFKSRRKFIVAESILVLIALGAGIAIVATFHRSSKVVVNGVSPSATGRSTPTGDSGSNDGSGTTSGSGSKSGTATSGPGGTTATGTPTPTAAPHGTVAFDRTGCSGCGQTTSAGHCSAWLEGFTNNSDTDVTSITFDPPAGQYETGVAGSPNYRTWPVPDPPAVTVNISIAPSRSQKVRWVTCTPAKPPAGSTAFRVTAPASFTWRWINGQRGKACFGAACS
jgi:hypothetical protein